MCFNTEVDTYDRLVWIKQCRIHYVCATYEDIEKYFEVHPIEFQLSFTQAPLQEQIDENKVMPNITSMKTFTLHINEINWRSKACQTGN